MNVGILKSLIDTSCIISFDVFDTLLKRDVYYPADVFDMTERIYNTRHRDVPLHCFRNIRMEAERKAREKTGREDVMLDWIYREMPFGSATCKELEQLECETEKEVSVCNCPIKEIYDYAVGKGKTVIAVSEMYLPEDFIHELLENAGYGGVERLYVSCEAGKMKRTGTLFRQVIRDYGIKPHDILHIGDARRSDWIVPRLLGMRSYRIKAHYGNTSYFTLPAQAGLDERTFYSFVNNHLPSSPNHRLGFETLGPVLWGLCAWIHGFVQKRKIRRVLFLARDGQIMEKAYREMYPDDETRYVYVSRRALTVPLLHLRKSWRDVVGLIPRATHVELHALMKRLGLDVDDYMATIEKVGLKGDDVIAFDKLAEDSRYESLYRHLKPFIDENSRKEFRDCATYFEGLGLQGTECIVDLGWKGTIQKALETLLPLYGLDVRLEALYLGISLDAPNAHGYIYGPGDLSRMPCVRGALGLMETLFSSDHGTLVKYGSDGLVLDKFEYDGSSSTRRDYQTISQIQEGALSFVRTFRKSMLSDMVNVDAGLAFYGLKRLCACPRRSDLAKLGNMAFFDTEVVPLAKPLRQDYHSISNLEYGFSHSHWKLGYLKRLFRIPLPYLAMYKFLRRLYVKDV